MFLSIIATGRELRKIITMLLKSKLATNITKMNYVQEYSLEQDKVVKKEKKLLYFHTEDKNKCLEILRKQNPSANEVFLDVKDF